MKIFLRFFYLSLLLVVGSGYAQQVDSCIAPANRSLSEEDYQRAKLLYVKMLDSRNWKRVDSISTILAMKYWKTQPPEFMDEAVYYTWIKENLHLTKFSSVDEAISMEQEWRNADNEVNKENVYLYELLHKASVEQIRAIMKPTEGLKNFNH